MSDSNSSGAKIVGVVASLAAAVLVFLLFSADSVEVVGMDVPAWLLALVCYGLGGVAVWGAVKG